MPDLDPRRREGAQPGQGEGNHVKQTRKHQTLDISVRSCRMHWQVPTGISFMVMTGCIVLNRYTDFV